MGGGGLLEPLPAVHYYYHRANIPVHHRATEKDKQIFTVCGTTCRHMQYNHKKGSKIPNNYFQYVLFFFFCFPFKNVIEMFFVAIALVPL